MSSSDNDSDSDEGGEVLAADLQALTAELYASLKRVARAQRGAMRGNNTLQTTALVSEAYVKLSRQSSWNSRAHFLRTAARIMRQVLVDYARAQLTLKRGGGGRDEVIDDIVDDDMEILLGESASRVIHIDLALNRLQQIDPKLARIVEYRFFAGYTDDEAAQLLGTSTRTLQREWVKARAWLYQELDPAEL